MADIAIHVVRPDSIPFEPVRIGPVLSSSRARIQRKINVTQIRDVDILDVVNNFNGELYVFIGVTLFLLLAAMTSAQFVLSRKQTFTKLVSSIANIVQELLFLILDQELFEPQQWAMRFLWTPFNFFVFIAIFGYLMNLMSSDQVANVPSDVIDSLEDLQAEKWRRQNVTPWLIKNLFLHSALRQASQLSQEGARLIQVRNRADIKFIDLFKIFADMSSMGNFVEHFMKYLNNGEMALLLSEFVMETLLIPGGCSLDPKFSGLFYASEDSFGDGVLTNYFNKNYPPGLVAYNEQRLRTAIEADVILHFMKSVTAPLVGGLFPISTGLPVLKCLSRFKEIPEQNPNYVKLRVLGLKSVFKFISFGVCLSFVVLAAEIVLHRVLKIINRCSRRRHDKNLMKVVAQIEKSRRLKWRHTVTISS